MKEMAFTSIKVTYEGTTRRMNVGEGTEWSDITARFSSLFDIHPPKSMLFTYIDSDGATITLSSIDELREALGDGVARFEIDVARVEVLSPDHEEEGANSLPRDGDVISSIGMKREGTRSLSGIYYR
jgi:hypothetical protein